MHAAWNAEGSSVPEASPHSTCVLRFRLLLVPTMFINFFLIKLQFLARIETMTSILDYVTSSTEMILRYRQVGRVALLPTKNLDQPWPSQNYFSLSNTNYLD